MGGTVGINFISVHLYIVHFKIIRRRAPLGRDPARCHVVVTSQWRHSTLRRSLAGEESTARTILIDFSRRNVNWSPITQPAPGVCIT